MRIGVFGDSFAAIPTMKMHINHVWYNILAKKLGGEVYNCELKTSGLGHGLGGSSTYWSYKKFLKYYHEFDYVIFSASDAVRYTKFVDVYQNNSPVTLHGLNSIDAYLKDDKISSETKELIKQIRTWYVVNDDEFMYDLQELLLSDIERKTNGKVLIMSAIREAAFTKQRIESSPIKFGLWDFTKVLHKSTGTTTFPNHANYERHYKIINHMTHEGNKYLADMLYDNIVNGAVLELPTFIKHEYSHEYYWDTQR